MSRRHKKYYKTNEPKYKEETEMIRNIIEVIEDKCEEGRFPLEFDTFLKQNSFSFVELNKFLE